MITILTLSKAEQLPALLAYQEGVYTFKFIGDKEFVGASQTWTWVGVQDEAPGITGVRAGTILLLEVDSLQDCIDNDQTFFYNIADGRLYVHWFGSPGDYSVGRDNAQIQQSNLFYANGIDNVGLGYFDSVLYEPKIKALSGFGLKVDPLKFGLVATSRSSVSLANDNGAFDNISLPTAKGAVAEVFVVEDDSQSLVNAVQVFKGFTDGLKVGSKQLTVQIEEQRFFLNGPVCPNVYTAAAGLKDSFVGKPKPVAFGDIRRGICVPLDSDGIEKDDVATITFQVADPAISSIRAITGLYDSNGNSVTLGTIDLVACTVEFAKAAGEDIDLDSFSWEGEGYDLESLTYNNGLDIMRFAFDQFGNTPFLTSTFDVVDWNIATANNPQPVGLSIQSTEGFTREIIEPVTVSLQGVVLTRGTGLITFISRDTEKAIKKRFTYEDRLGDVVTDYDVDAFVSSVVVGFSRDFTKKESILEENTSFEADVIRDYGLKTRGTISPVNTVLRDRADGLAVGDEIMDTSNAPDRPIAWSVKMFDDRMDLLPLDIIDMDAGRFEQIDRKKVELLRIVPNYNNYTLQLIGRILEDIEDDLAAPSLYGPGLYGVSVYGG